MFTGLAATGRVDINLIMRNKNSTKKEPEAFNRPYAITSVILVVASVVGYFLAGFLENRYNLSPGEFKVALLLVAAISALSVIAAIVATAIAYRWHKLLFAFFLLISILICSVCLFVASFIGSIG